MDTEVLIAGAGPVGLMLAGELRLGGVDVVVCERRRQPSGESRGLGFTARAAEVFDQRGLLERLGPAEASRNGHFGGIPMDFGVLPGAHFGIRGVPQYRVEAMLEGWARQLGARIHRGREVVDLRQDPDEVEVTLTGPGGPVGERMRARYLVGCDGGRSSVRRLAAFAFPGTEATREMYLADVVGRSIRPRFIGERLPGGMVMSAPLEDDVDRIIVCEQGVAAPSERRTVGFDEVADAWERLTGESLHGATVRWVSMFTDATRQASRYRQGRVLLAGDAAHVHLPAGGQGLSVGVQDAVNLGWKLAGTVRGWAPAGLLDTYHDERHPVGVRLLRNTQAQGMLYLTGVEIEPLRSVMAELIAIPAVGRHLAGMVSGLDIRYPVTDGTLAHPLLGLRMSPDRALVDRRTNGRGRIGPLLHRARGVLVTDDTTGRTARLAGPWTDRIDPIEARWTRPEDDSPGSVLLRPDGHVVWVSVPDALPGAGLEHALRRWFGLPAPTSPAPTLPAAISAEVISDGVISDGAATGEERAEELSAG